MSGKNVLIVSEIKGVPIDPNAQDDNLRGDIFALDRKIAQNDSDKRAIQRMTDDKRITPKQASTANQRIDADNAKLKEKRSELKEKLKKNEAARAAKQSTATKAADKPVVPNVQGLLFSRRVSVDQIINNALGRDQGYQCTADKPLKQVLQERFNDHLSGRFPLPPQESLKLRADLQAEFDREHPGQQSAWPAYSNDERAYIRDEAEKKAAHDNNLTIATQSAFAGGAVAAGYTAGADPRTVNKFGTAVLAAEGLLGARRGGQGKKSPQNSVPASTRNPQPTTPRPTPQSNAGGAGNGVAIQQANPAGQPRVARIGERRISDELYRELRTQTPTSDIRDAVNNGKTFPHPDEALPGKTVTQRLQADHIVSMDRITRMEGFDQLTKTEKISVLNNSDNFYGLSRSANSSKGPKSYEDWTEHKRTNTPVDPEFRSRMIERERQLESQLQEQIDSYNRARSNTTRGGS